QRELKDPSAELLRAEAAISEIEEERRRLQQRFDELGQRAAENQAALTVLREALGEAASGYLGHADEDAQQRALAQLAWLLSQQATAAAATTSGNGHAVAAAVAEGPVPTRSILTAVAAQQRALSSEQRDWVVGEALAAT